MGSVTPSGVTDRCAGTGVVAAIAGATVVKGGVADGVGVHVLAARAVGVSLVSDPVGVVVISLGFWC